MDGIDEDSLRTYGRYRTATDALGGSSLANLRWRKAVQRGMPTHKTGPHDMHAAPEGR